MRAPAAIDNDSINQRTSNQPTTTTHRLSLLDATAYCSPGSTPTTSVCLVTYLLLASLSDAHSPPLSMLSVVLQGLYGWSDGDGGDGGDGGPSGCASEQTCRIVKGAVSGFMAMVVLALFVRVYRRYSRKRSQAAALPFQRIAEVTDRDNLYLALEGHSARATRTVRCSTAYSGRTANSKKQRSFECDLAIDNHGTVRSLAASGTDDLGHYDIHGTFKLTSLAYGRIAFTKSYVSHSVQYAGELSIARQLVSGSWRAEAGKGDDGTFCIGFDEPIAIVDTTPPPVADGVNAAGEGQVVLDVQEEAEAEADADPPSYRCEPSPPAYDGADVSEQKAACIEMAQLAPPPYEERS